MDLESIENALLMKVRYHISDEKELTDIAINTDFISVKNEAILKIKDQKNLGKIAISLTSPKFQKLRHRVLQKCEGHKVPTFVLMTYWDASEIDHEDIKILKHCVKRVDDESIVFRVLTNEAIFNNIWDDNFLKFFKIAVDKIKTRYKINIIKERIIKEIDEFENDAFALSSLNLLLINCTDRLNNLSLSLDFFLNED
jgi:hypothetical protein